MIDFDHGNRRCRVEEFIERLHRSPEFQGCGWRHCNRALNYFQLSTQETCKSAEPYQYFTSTLCRKYLYFWQWSIPVSSLCCLALYYSLQVAILAGILQIVFDVWILYRMNLAISGEYETCVGRPPCRAGAFPLLRSCRPLSALKVLIFYLKRSRHDEEPAAGIPRWWSKGRSCFEPVTSQSFQNELIYRKPRKEARAAVFWSAVACEKSRENANSPRSQTASKPARSELAFSWFSGPTISTF